jgi:hypothetical protein
MKVNEPYAPVTLPPKKINFIGTSILWSWALLDVVYHTATVVNVRHCHCLPLLATTSQYLPLLGDLCYSACWLIQSLVSTAGLLDKHLSLADAYHVVGTVHFDTNRQCFLVY